MSDLGPIAGLTRMTRLWLDRTRVSDLRPIAGLTRMSELHFSNTQVSDLEPIAGLTGMSELHFSNTQVSDLGPIAGMTGMTVLSLIGTQVSDLGPIAGMTGMTGLLLDFTQVSDLGPIAGMTGMTGLFLKGTQVSDLGPIAGMRELKYLDLRETPVPKVALRYLAGKPRLVPKEMAATDPAVMFAGSAAAREDARLGEIAEIEDPRARMLALFDYLGFDERGEPIAPGPVAIPPRRPAPLEVGITDTAIVLSGPGALPVSDANARAAMGWEALKEYRDEFAKSFAVHNYRPLPERLEAFDRAMGEGYDPHRVIRIWTQGQRLAALTRDAELMASLPSSAAEDLRGFAAAIALYAERFPDVIAYREEAQPDDVSPAAVRAAEAEFRAIDGVILATPEAQDDVKTGVHAIVEEGTAQDADETAARGLVASGGEWMRETAEAVARQKKAQQKRNRALADKGGEFWDDRVVKPLGLPFHLARKFEGPMRRLSARFPNRMGWAARWYDETFGSPDDPDRKG